ncbi:uncharacterized protein V5649_011242 [Rhynchonycteris naso]
MEYFVFDDISSMIQNEAIKRLISPMTVQLCHLIIAMERNNMGSEVFASLEKTAVELAQASEQFVQIANRLARASEEKWLQEEMGPTAHSLIKSGRNIVLVAEKLHLQPECQSHREELVTTAQQILLDTTKVLLLEDAAAARTMARAAGRCLTCLDALEAAGAGSPRGPWTDLAAALLSLGRLGTRWPVGCLLRGQVPALLTAVRAQSRRPPLDAARRHLFTLARETLGQLLERLEPGALATPVCAHGVLPQHLRQLHTLGATPGPEHLRGRLDTLLAAVLWPCMRLAAGAAPPERMSLVASCRRLLELRGLEPEEERAALRAATEALSQGVHSGLLRQILGTFTDTQSPLQRLVQVALETTPVSSRCPSVAVPKSLQLLLAAFQEQAQQMLQVGHLVLVCCPRQQTGRDLEATLSGLWELVVTVQQLFSQGPQESSLDCSPSTLQALLQAWAKESECLLACFDDVLNIPEFLSVSIQEMTKHLNFFTWALRSGDSQEFPRLVAYLQGRASHIVRVMNRYVDQDQDPIFRNGLRILIQQLEQSSQVLGVAAECCSGGLSSQDRDVFLTTAKHLICAAQRLQEGLDGTNHPAILSPVRHQVQRFDMVKRQSYILPNLQDSPAPELTHQRESGLGKSDPGTSYPPRDCLSSPLIPDTCTQRRAPPCPIISKLALAGESRSHQAVSSARASTSPQEWGVAVDAARGSLAGEGPLGSERMNELQEIPTLAPSVTDLAGNIAYGTAARATGILEISLQQSQRSRNNRQDLVAMAGDWYPLCQQLFCHNPAADLPESTTVFMELQQNLVSMAQLAAKSGPMDWGKKNPDSTGHPEALLQMQNRLEEAETHAKQLLDKVLVSDDLQDPILWEENFEDRCLLWSVAVQDLLQCMERLSWRQGLFLQPLRQAVKGQQGLQEGLAQAANVSQRLQEAARLSRLLCGDEQVKGEVSFLCREVYVLTDALLDVAQILSSSPRPSPSLSTRFELLCLELILRARTLTGHLSSINEDYRQALQDAFCPQLSVCKDPQTPNLRPYRQESSLERMVSGIQAVRAMVVGSQESGPCQEDLLVALESILVLTQEVAQRVPVLQECPEDEGMHILDWLQWEWAAKAHHALAQLQAWKGGHTKACKLLASCLKASDERDPAKPQLHLGEGASGAAAMGGVSSQGADAGVTPGSSAGTSTARPASAGTVASDLDRCSSTAGSWTGPPKISCRSMKGLTTLKLYEDYRPNDYRLYISTMDQHLKTTGSGSLSRLDYTAPSRFFTLQVAGIRVESEQQQPGDTPSRTTGCLAWPHAELDQPPQEDRSTDGGNRITQVTQEMAQEVLLMAQSLRRRGHLLTKEQLIASARKVATAGQNFARLIHIVAKNCVDQRCSRELACAVEQIQTMSSQLRIISSVKSSLARSKSSEELLLGNAQQLLHAVSKTVRATEAASLRGLRQLSSDPEELEVAAFCTQWRRDLLQHRLQEAASLDCDELGLRKTSTKTPPTLAALVQEAL